MAKRISIERAVNIALMRETFFARSGCRVRPHTAASKTTGFGDDHVRCSRGSEAISLR